MAHSKVQSAALRDVALISLVKANTSMATEDDRNLLQHVIACQAPRPCPTHVNCDMGKEQLVHFRQCRDRTCDLCALARLIVARDKNRPIAEWQVKLLGARRSLIKATAKVKDTASMVSQTRSSEGGNVAEAKTALLEAKNLQREAKKTLDYVCGRIYDEWLPFAEDHGSLQVAGEANENSDAPSVQGAKVEIAQTPPKEPPVIIHPSPKGGQVARIPQTPPSRDSSMRSARVPRSPSTHDTDVLATLIRANTNFATPEDRALYEHISVCNSPRPCPTNGLCDVGKERLVHFGSCRTKTCDICAFGRLIEAKDKQRPVGDFEGPLLKARAQVKRTFGEAKVAMNAYLNKKLEAGGQAEAARLKPEMDAAKQAHAVAKTEYERLCALVFSEWSQIRNDSSENKSEMSRRPESGQLQPSREMISKPSLLQSEDSKDGKVRDTGRNVQQAHANKEQILNSSVDEQQSSLQAAAAFSTEASGMASSAESSTIFRIEKHITLGSEKDMEAMIVSLVKSQSTKSSTNPRDSALFAHASICTNPGPCNENGACDAAKEAWDHYVNCDSAPCLCCTMARLVALQEKRDMGMLQSMLLKARSGFVSAKKLLEKAEEQGGDNRSKEELHNDFQRAKGAFDFLSKEILDKWRTLARPSPFAQPRRMNETVREDSAMDIEQQPRDDVGDARMELQQQFSNSVPPMTDVEKSGNDDDNEKQQQQANDASSEKTMMISERNDTSMANESSEEPLEKEERDSTEHAIVRSTSDSETKRGEFTRLPPPHAFTSSIIPSPVISARSLSSNLIRDISEGSMSDVLISAPSPRLISSTRALGDSSNVSDKSESGGSSIAVRMISSSSSGDEKGLLSDRQTTSSSLDFDAIQINESDMRQISDSSVIIPSPMKPSTLARPASATGRKDHSDSTIIPSPMASTARRELFKEETSVGESDPATFSLAGPADNNGNVEGKGDEVEGTTTMETKQVEKVEQVEDKKHPVNTQAIVPSPMLTSTDYDKLRQLRDRSGSSVFVSGGGGEGTTKPSTVGDEQSIIVPSPMLTKMNVEALLASNRYRSDSSAVLVSDIAMPTPLPSTLTDSKVYIRERSESLRVPVPSYASSNHDKSGRSKMVDEQDDGDQNRVDAFEHDESVRNSSVNDKKPTSSSMITPSRSDKEDFLGSISKSLLLNGQPSSSARIGKSSSKFSVLMRTMRNSSDDLDAGSLKNHQDEDDEERPSQASIVTEALEFSPRMNGADDSVLSQVREANVKQGSKDGDRQNVAEAQHRTVDEMQFDLDVKSHMDDSNLADSVQMSPGPAGNVVSTEGKGTSDVHDDSNEVSHESNHHHHQWSASVDFDVDDSHYHEYADEEVPAGRREGETTSDHHHNNSTLDGGASTKPNSKATENSSATAVSGGVTSSKNNLLASLVRASTRYGTSEDREFSQHVSSCTAPRPCLQHPQCDAGKLQLVHFQKCQDRTCDSCAVARLVEAKDRNHDVSELETALLEAREKLTVAAKDLKAAIGLKSNVPKCKEAHKAAKKELEAVCDRIFLLWSNKNHASADESTTSTPQSTRQSHYNRSSSHSAGVQGDLPLDAPSYNTRSAAKRLRRASVDSFSPISSTNNNSTSPMKRSSVASNSSPHATKRTRSMSSSINHDAATTTTSTAAMTTTTNAKESITSYKDVLKRIVLAEVEDALDENVAFRDHVLACRAPKPCAFEDCTLAKDRMAHFQSCQKHTCESCSLARLIQAKRGGSSIKISESHFARVRDDHLVANERTTRAIKSFMESKGDPKLAAERRRALDEAKDTRNKLRVELDNLCQGIFKEWSKHWLNKHRH